MKGIAARDDKSYEYYWDTEDEKISLHSHQEFCGKNVLALGSVPPIIGVTKDDSKQKPAFSSSMTSPKEELTSWIKGWVPIQLTPCPHAGS